MKIKVNKHKLNIHYRGSPWGSRTQQHAYCLRYAHSHHIESHLGKKQPQVKIAIAFLFGQLHFNNVTSHALFYRGHLVMRNKRCAVQNQGITLNKRILIQQPFLHWVHFGGKFKVTSEMQLKHGICAWKKEQLLHHDVHILPWFQHGLDFFEHRFQHYLLVTDYFSKFLIVKKMSNLMPRHMINLFKTKSAEYGCHKWSVRTNQRSSRRGLVNTDSKNTI